MPVYIIYEYVNKCIYIHMCVCVCTGRDYEISDVESRHEKHLPHAYIYIYMYI